MDAVSQVREQFEQVFGEWCGEAPLVLADSKKFGEWAGQGPTLYDTAQALGIDTKRVIRTLSGDMPAMAKSRGTGRGRTRTRSTSSSRSNGHAPTTSQLLGTLRKDGALNQSQLATRFHTSRQTIAKRLDEMVASGDVTRQGTGAKLTWQARELVPA